MSKAFKKYRIQDFSEEAESTAPPKPSHSLGKIEPGDGFHKVLLRRFDEYCLQGGKPSGFQVVETVFDEITKPRGDGNVIMFYGKVLWKSAVAVRKWQLERAREFNGENVDDPVCEFFDNHGYELVRKFRTRTASYFIGDLVYASDRKHLRALSKNSTTNSYGSRSDNVVLYTNTMEDLGFSIATSFREGVDGSYRTYGTIHVKGVLENAMKWIQDVFWSHAEHGAGFHKVQLGYDDTVYVPLALDLRPKYAVRDPSNGFHRKIEDRIAHFYDKGVKRGLLLDGLPGTGKSTFARSICADRKVRRMLIDAESTANYSIEDFIEMLAPQVILFDDIDREPDSAKDMLRFLESMDHGPKLIVASVNDITQLDPALLRSGRFDEVHRLPMPSGPYRESLIRTYDPNMSDEQVITLVGETDGMTPAEINEVVIATKISGWDNRSAELARIRKQREYYTKFASPEDTELS